MLTLTLRNLERDGLVTRTVHPTVPPKVEYELTPVARELHATLLSLTDWAERNRVTIAESRAAYDAEHRPELLDA
jgi:DNA-binding HxlR family transcriptional regulator